MWDGRGVNENLRRKRMGVERGIWGENGELGMGDEKVVGGRELRCWKGFGAVGRVC